MARCSELEELKYQLMELKKRLHAVTNDNSLLIVKVRKLENELSKKNKQIESLLDPTKTTCIRKIVSERGATMLINLKQRNEELETALSVKKDIIKKLQTELELCRIYKNRDSVSVNIVNANNPIPLKYRDSRQKTKDPKHNSTESLQNSLNKGNKIRSRSLSVTPTHRQSYLKSSSDIEVKSVQLAQNLHKIKMANNTNRRSCSLANEIKSQTNSRATSARVPSIKNLSIGSNGVKSNEKCYRNIAEEMEKIREMVQYLTTQQECTKKELKDKKNMELLARKVKCLEKDRPIKSPMESRANIRTPDTATSEERVTSSIHSYSQESFESESPRNNNSEPKPNTEERFSDDDDVETGESQ